MAADDSYYILSSAVRAAWDVPPACEFEVTRDAGVTVVTDAGTIRVCVIPREGLARVRVSVETAE